MWAFQGLSLCNTQPVESVMDLSFTRCCDIFHQTHFSYPFMGLPRLGEMIEGISDIHVVYLIG